MADDWEYFGEDWKMNFRDPAIPEGWDELRQVGMTTRLREWLRTRIGVATEARKLASLHDLDVAWIARRLDDETLIACLHWFTNDRISPNIRTTGEWGLNVEIAKRAVAGEIQSVLQGFDATRYDTLDDWLRAEMANELYADGVSGGSNNLDSDVAEALEAAAHTRRARWPRECKECKQEFRPRRRRNAVTCEECVSRRRNALAEARRARKGSRWPDEGASSAT